MEIKRCMNCMEELSENTQCCPACGVDNRKIEQPNYALRLGAMLHGRYFVGKVLGQGGFGITYIGLDLLFNVKVAIKEYFPMGMVTRDSSSSSKILWNTSQASQTQRQSGYDSFLKEARKMAKIDQIPSIVRVRDLFLENETAYIVMDYVGGVTLKEKLQQTGPIAFSDCVALLRPMLEDLAKVHKEGVIHRDISPDNIMIQPDGSVRLLDLGAAKDMTAVQGVSSQVVAKKGFSPFEQYKSGGEIGPWTDVYALCATIYYCITGKLLPDALDRIDKGEVKFPECLKELLSEENKEALRAGLEVRVNKRTQSIGELLRQLDAGKTGEEIVEGKRQEEEEEGDKAEGVEGGRQKLKSITDSGQNEGIEQAPTDKGGSSSKAPKVKKGIWVALAACLVLVGVFIKVVSEPKDLPMMMEDVEGIESYTVLGSDLKREHICTIIFEGNLKNQPKDAWDVSEKQDGNVMAWVSPAGNGMYELYIGGKGGVQAPESCEKLFAYYDSVEEIKFNGYFDTSQVTDMEYMFYCCKKLRELDVSEFDTSQVTDMEYMFYCCGNLNKLDVSNFDTSQVRSMGCIFSGCEGLSELELGNFDTNQVNDMGYMFSNCHNLSELDISNFDTSQVKSMENMFSNCHNLSELDISNFDTSQVWRMESMFSGCYNLSKLDVSNFDTSQVWSMEWMFSDCHNLSELDISNFDTSQVWTMENMFSGCYNLSELDISNFDTSQVTNMRDMFSNCYNLNKLDVSNFDTSQVTNMRDMFSNCKNLKQLDLSSFDMSNVYVDEDMFENCPAKVTGL